MRSSKYHDYRVLKVILFIILVVLGLFIYAKCTNLHEHTIGDKWIVDTPATCTSEGLQYKACTICDFRMEEEAIPMTAHVADSVKYENVKESTCTVGGSHDEVVYCADCGYKMSERTVQDAMLDHTPGKAKKENFVDSTHTKTGTYDMIVYCVDCGAELSDHKDTVKGIVVPEKGHSYVWSAEYDAENDRFLLHGECTCDEDGNKVTLTDGDAGIKVERDTNYAPCCLNRWYISYVYYGKTVKLFVDLPLENHKFYVENVLDHENGFVDIFDFAKYDEAGAYFDYSDMLIHVNVRIAEGEEWGVDGFRDGYFRCLACEEVECDECCPNGGYSWRKVRLYNAEFDIFKSEED